MRHSDRLFIRVALIGAISVSLGLTACGRKGPLDPPPGASLAGAQGVPAGEETKEQRDSRPVLGVDGKPIAPGGKNRPIPLDVLLN